MIKKTVRKISMHVRTSNRFSKGHGLTPELDCFKWCLYKEGRIDNSDIDAKHRRYYM